MNAMLQEMLQPRAEPPEAARVVVAPHAGWVYSGAIAGEVYARVRVPKRVVVMCPNHTGMGVRRSIWVSGRWQLPGGDVIVDRELAEHVRDHAELEEDHLAHLREHAVEVQLPFLRALNPDVLVVPVVLSQLSLRDCHQVGRGLARAIREVGLDDVLVVASTDMSHYISAEQARRRDTLALERLLALDPDGLFEVVRREDISMCGYIPTTVALVAALELGASHAELVRYGNSGDVSGDYEAVVGYAGAVVVRLVDPEAVPSQGDVGPRSRTSRRGAAAG